MPEFNAQTFNKPFLDQAKKLVDDIFPEIVFLALSAKYGGGIISVALLPPEVKHEMEIAMSPLRRQLEIKAFSSSFEAFMGVQNESSIQEFLKYRAAVDWGKKGGRLLQRRAPHLLWLENKMREQENNNLSLTKLTASQHFTELVDQRYINVDAVDNSMEFSETLKDKFCRDHQESVPSLTMATIKRVLTRMRKN